VHWHNKNWRRLLHSKPVFDLNDEPIYGYLMYRRHLESEIEAFANAGYPIAAVGKPYTDRRWCEAIEDWFETHDDLFPVLYVGVRPRVNDYDVTYWRESTDKVRQQHSFPHFKVDLFEGVAQDIHNYVPTMLFFL